MTNIHPQALVSPKADLAEDVCVGPFAQIGPDVVIARGSKIHSLAIVTGKTHVGENCQIFPFASVGEAPQDIKYEGEDSRVVIGKNTTIREHATIHRGSKGGNLTTSIGENCLLMIGCHIAHDCELGDNVILTNNVLLAGHVTIYPNAILGGGSAVHQFCRIGQYSMVGGMTRVVRDVLPYALIEGFEPDLKGPNLKGLRRAGYSNKEIQELNGFFQDIKHRKTNTLHDLVTEQEAVEKSKGSEASKLIYDVLDWFKSKSIRGHLL